MNPSKSIPFLACLLGLSVITHGTTVLAQEIHSCVKNSTLRIVSAPADCLPSETPLSWSQQGPAGSAGPQGPAGPPGPAAPSTPRSGLQYIGPSEFATTGRIGIMRMNGMCTRTYGSSARMCTSVEIMNSTNVPLTPSTGWIQPVLQFGSDVNPPDAKEILVMDASGVTNRTLSVNIDPKTQRGSLSCEGWSTSFEEVTGLTIQEGQIEPRICALELPVACCAPPAEIPN